MNCKSVRSQLDALMDGELDATMAASIRRHFETCPCCSQEFQSLTLLKKELTSLSSPTLAEDFEDRLARRVFAIAEQRPAKVRLRFQVASFAAAVAAAITVASLQILADQRRSDMAAQEKRFELDRDQAFVAGEDPLSGGSFMMPASYGRH